MSVPIFANSEFGIRKGDLQCCYSTVVLIRFFKDYLFFAL